MDAAALAFYFVVVSGSEFMTDWRQEGPYRTVAECHQAAAPVAHNTSECYAVDLSRFAPADDPARRWDIPVTSRARP